MCSGPSCAVVGEWLLSLGLSFLIRETGRVEVLPALRVLGGLNGTLAGCPACDGRPGVCALPACFLQGVRLPVCLAGHRLSPPPQAVCPPSLWALEGWSPSCRLMRPRGTVMSETGAPVCRGCHDKAPQSGGSDSRNARSQFWSQEVRIQGVGRRGRPSKAQRRFGSRALPAPSSSWL